MDSIKSIGKSTSDKVRFAGSEAVPWKPRAMTLALTLHVSGARSPLLTQPPTTNWWWCSAACTWLPSTLLVAISWREWWRAALIVVAFLKLESKGHLSCLKPTLHRHYTKSLSGSTYTNCRASGPNAITARRSLHG
jgi:hypothetical protein